MIVTMELINKGKSSNGAWNKKQMQCLGYPQWKRGWIRKSIGKYISDEMANEFLKLKDEHLKNQEHEKENNRETHRASFKEQRKQHNKTVNQINELIDRFVEIPSGINIPWQEQYLHPNWQRRRLSVLARDSFKCVVCGNKDAQLHVHHLFYEGRFIWDTPIGAMISVCDICHGKIHNKRFKK